MDYIVALGAVSLGVIVGWMVYHTVRQETLNAKVFGSIVSVRVGAGVIGIFQKVAGDKSSSGLPHEVYLYPVGLLIGIAATATIKFVAMTEAENKERKAGGPESVKQNIVQHISHKGFRMMRASIACGEISAKRIGPTITFGPSSLDILRKYTTPLLRVAVRVLR